MAKIHKIMKQIAKQIPANHCYAHALLEGRQEWSGADLAAKARKWSSYSYTRTKISELIKAAGGVFVATEHGRIVAATTNGMDDYGNQIFSTETGAKVLKTKFWTNSP